MPYTPLDVTEVASLIDDDVALVKLCNFQRMALSSSPTQSGFRVFALLFFETSSLPGIQLVEGSNTEPSYIGGSICAERAALSKLRMFSDPKMVKLVVTTDSGEPISPGLLCREYIFSHADSSLPIVFGDGASSTVVSCSIEKLYPFPFAYRRVLGNNIGDVGRALSSTLLPRGEYPITEGGWNEDIEQCYTLALRATESDKSPIHPLKLGACVQYLDGSREVAWQLKGLEYGCTLDPVCQLIRGMLLDCQKNAPLFLCMVDQFGIAHAPFAQARALLSEHGFGSLLVAVHTVADGVLTPCVTSVADLAPSPTGRLLTSKDLLPC